MIGQPYTCSGPRKFASRRRLNLCLAVRWMRVNTSPAVVKRLSRGQLIGQLSNCPVKILTRSSDWISFMVVPATEEKMVGRQHGWVSTTDRTLEMNLDSQDRSLKRFDRDDRG